MWPLVAKTAGSVNVQSDVPAVIVSKYLGATLRKGNYEDNGSWEGKINYSVGCREIKVGTSQVLPKKHFYHGNGIDLSSPASLPRM
ncbi:MAG: hypothetical protein UX91_C0006G0081 [Candidatus Amesbacteria bacterium GW2011_GWB1_47_19]|nr:MAG: hypothetical protein UW51_C0002G0082 [Candidatus Amesbacteria bacterium GW2011_GWA1_44_24]KKU31328.1 MAG: hypothetical protein UX46_C0006G0120 [Candidatus Amesbacteria bacterium GW2011_GWC1_46_24]KKU67019.1 MAG: hypothetical protein UX91_C0006G0081 [Candidatus Amesbacteria bacterium GW2011_GWB1_47_19]